MRNILFFSLAFSLGFLAHSFAESTESHGKVTGIGGVFFQSNDPAALKAWYEKHLGMPMNEHGVMFEWKTLESKRGVTQWSVMKSGSKYFAPSKSPLMINYRVDNLQAMVKRLKEEKVEVLDSIEVTDYGNFVHVLDGDGNKVELWEPPQG